MQLGNDKIEVSNSIGTDVKDIVHRYFDMDVGMPEEVRLQRFGNNFTLRCLFDWYRLEIKTVSKGISANEIIDYVKKDDENKRGEPLISVFKPKKNVKIAPQSHEIELVMSYR